MGWTCVLAEKPSVARDIARVLGAREAGEGCLKGNGYVVTWALGHLITQCLSLIHILARAPGFDLHILLYDKII